MNQWGDAVTCAPVCVCALTIMTQHYCAPSRQAETKGFLQFLESRVWILLCLFDEFIVSILYIILSLFDGFFVYILWIFCVHFICYFVYLMDFLAAQPAEEVWPNLPGTLEPQNCVLVYLCTCVWASLTTVIGR